MRPARLLSRAHTATINSSRRHQPAGRIYPHTPHELHNIARSTPTRAAYRTSCHDSPRTPPLSFGYYIYRAARKANARIAEAYTCERERESLMETKARARARDRDWAYRAYGGSGVAAAFVNFAAWRSSGTMLRCTRCVAVYVCAEHGEKCKNYAGTLRVCSHSLLRIGLRISNEPAPRALFECPARGVYVGGCVYISVFKNFRGYIISDAKLT